jgi:Gas vesicle synthesis protein GvpL/GvpF
VIGQSDQPAAGAPAAGGAGSAVYVYGVVAGGPAPPPARTIEHGGLAAVVRDVPADWQAATRDDVAAHEQVLSALLERTTVVPMRFGVVLPSEDDVRTVLLDRHGDEIRALLGRLEGRVQMSVKAFYAEDALLREVLRAHPDLKQRSDALQAQPPEASQAERIELGRAVAQAVEEQRAADEHMLAEPLATVADGVRLEPAASERVALNAQVLVAREHRKALDHAVGQLTSAYGDRFAIRYVGPLPPYSFADLSLDPGDPAWG